ncbi:MAG: DNA polymerase II [Chitinispirillales bacterium]|nr:DNA polymerase II [Chitinispirillales bacterium]
MNNTTIECFLLTAHCRDNGNRFEITLWGASSSGERVRIFIDDFRPLFFCPRSVPASETAAASERKQLSMRSFDGGDVDCLYFANYSLMQQAAKRLKSARHTVFESDVSPMWRYLMERMVSGSMVVTGTPGRFGQFVNFTNPRLRGGAFTPKLEVMAVCVDGVDGEAISKIACVDEAQSHVFADRDERRLLVDFLAYTQERDPDIIIGWKVIDNALKTIRERCEANGVPFEPGREKGSRVTSSQYNRSWRGNDYPRTVWTARIPGRAVIDVPAMLRGYHHSPDEYQPDFSDCLTGARSIFDIFNRAEILQNAIERSKRSGQTLDSAGGSVASFDHLYLPRLHRAGYVAGDTADIVPPSQPLLGGHVLEPAPGLYENVLVFDFKSLYPSIIMTFMIDPLGFRVRDGDRVSNPMGSSFSKNHSLMPEIIRELLAARAVAAEQKNPYLSTAIKLMMNSFAGVMGATGCRFFSEHVSAAITGTGRYILKASIEHIENVCGKKVIYGDTDSIFVNLGAGMEDGADKIGKEISTETGVWLKEYLSEKFGVQSALELKYENHYRRFFIPSLRSGDTNQGTKKHYCGATIDKDGAIELTFRGMESARSDWTDLAKDFQRELFIKFFSGQPLEDYILTTVSLVQKGKFDERLIYKKRMRKSIDSYTVNIPPHVQAAKLSDSPARLIKYCITQSGPQPLEKLTAPLDYQHYIDSQLRPIADSILLWMGTDFDKITSGQQDLFG